MMPIRAMVTAIKEMIIVLDYMAVEFNNKVIRCIQLYITLEYDAHRSQGRIMSTLEQVCFIIYFSLASCTYQNTS